MSGQDRLIDIVTGDVQAAADGKFVMTDDLANKIILSYSIPLGSWEGDPTLGERISTELARAVDTVETRERLRDLAAEPVQWLVDAGELDRVEVDVVSIDNGVVAFQPRCYAPGTSTPVAGVGLISIGGG